jgi:hypothetical protein
MDSKSPFEERKFDVEHALSMYAYSYVNMPASFIYDDAAIVSHADILERCHVYLIGLVPKATAVEAPRRCGESLITVYEVGGVRQELDWPLPPDTCLKEEHDRWFLQTAEGERVWVFRAARTSASWSQI